MDSELGLRQIAISYYPRVTWWDFYFRFFLGTIRSPQVVEFLKHLLRHLHGSGGSSEDCSGSTARWAKVKARKK